MKKNIHPKYKEIKLIIGKDVVKSMSTCTEEEITLDIDFRKHPAWTGKAVGQANSINKSIQSFNKKFAGLEF